MSHVAMVTIDAHGHVNPSLPVLTELLRSAALALTGSPQVAARSQALARELHSASGAALAADIIERQLR
jgi:UDP:flavonoid glycosyltransferase YjiC (YdhE family)